MLRAEAGFLLDESEVKHEIGALRSPDRRVVHGHQLLHKGLTCAMKPVPQRDPETDASLKPDLLPEKFRELEPLVRHDGNEGQPVRGALIK